VWLLRPSDTPSTARLRIFSEFVTEALKKAQPLFDDERPDVGQALQPISLSQGSYEFRLDLGEKIKGGFWNKALLR
jgi:hypothetical protein